MEIVSLFGLFILVIASLFQPTFVGGNSLSTCGGIFEGDSGEFEYHRENGNVDDSSGSSVCIWMIKLLSKNGTGVSLKLEDLDQNSVVNFYAEGEPTDPVKPPNTLDSSQINSTVELSGQIFIITLKSQLDQLENSPTKFVVSWTSLEQLSTADSNSNSSKILPVELMSTNYFAGGGEKGRYNFKNFRPLQKSVWILDASFGGSLDAEVNVQFDSSCLSQFKSKKKYEMNPKSLCECSYFGLFEIVPSSGKLRSVNEICGRSVSLPLPKLSTQLVVFIYSMDSTSGSVESAQISWERAKETTNPTTEFPSSPKPPIEVSTCPQSSAIEPCLCFISSNGAQLICQGGAVTQTSIQNAFKETRRVNGIPEDHGIQIYEFAVDETELTELDLAPFYGSQMDYLLIYGNRNLTQVVTSGDPEGQGQGHGSIHVAELRFHSSPVKRDGFGDLLLHLSNDLTTIYAEGLDLSDGQNSDQDGGQFLAQLSVHTNLQQLFLMSCNISGPLSFDTLITQELPNLQQINLNSNSINEIGENVFDFDARGDYLDINLQVNQLNETSFHPNSGIARTDRQTRLDLYKNRIRTLPAAIFETFLDAYPDNFVDLLANPLICDERVSWLKSRREEFQQRVLNADCSNDEGHTVFDSDFIP